MGKNVTIPRIGLSAVLALAASLSSRALFAAEAGAGASEPASSAAAPLDHPASVLDKFAQDAHDSRITSAWWSIGGGAALTGAGLLTVYTGDRESYGHFVWIAGVLSLTGGFMQLFIPSDLETLDRDSGGHAPGYTPEALESAWRKRAAEARTFRHVSGITNLTLGAAGVTAGTLLAAGVGDLSSSDRTAWCVASYVAGGVLTLGGIITLVRPSDTEKGYHIAFPKPATLQVDVGVVPVQGGSTLQLFGTF